MSGAVKAPSVADTGRLPKAGFRLDQRLRRWTNGKQTVI